MLFSRITKCASLITILLLAQTSTAADQTAAAIKILERMDKNGDGRLDPAEIPDQSRAAFNRIVGEAGLSGKSSVSISKLRKKLEQEKKSQERASRREEKDDSKSSRSERSSDSNSKKTTSSSNGFGGSSKKSSTKKNSGFGSTAGSKRDPKVIAYVDNLFKQSDKNRNNYLEGKELQTVRSRDTKAWDKNGDGRVSRSEVTSYVASGGRSSVKKSEPKKSSKFGTRETATTSKSSSSSSSSKYADRYKRYAQSLVKRYDKNKNGYLEKSEWGRVRDAETADKNRDGVLTVDEYANQLKAMANKSSSSKSSSTKSSKDSKRDERSSRDKRRDDKSSRRSEDRDRRSRDSKESGPKRSYRALTAHERLPSGLPDWFRDKDKNENGQIEMSEYTSSWSNRKVEEFAKLDSNDDGVITAVECLKNE